jgi:hypothetical protein
MPTYLYCLGSSDGPVFADLRGIDGATVRALAARSDVWGVAWVSDLAVAPIEPTLERLRAHEAVCTAALERGETSLPMRFGQLFADDAACVSGLERNAASLARRLARVAGCVEFRIVVGAPEAPVADGSLAPTSPSGAGRAYLDRVAGRARREEAIRANCAAVAEAVSAGLASAHRVRLRDHTRCVVGRGGTAVLAHLVERDSVPSYREVVADVLRGLGDGCVLLGPHPPYSFAVDV